MTNIAIERLMDAYDSEADEVVHTEGMAQWVIDLGFRQAVTRADIEEDFNVMQDYITAALENYQPYI